MEVKVEMSGSPLNQFGAKLIGVHFNGVGPLIGPIVQGMLVTRSQDAGARATGEYIRGWQAKGSVEVADMEAQGSVYSVTVTFRNQSPYAAIIEDGHKAFHLPSKVNWSTAPRVKRTKDGSPYLHIPFRHGAFQTDAERKQSGATNAYRMMPQHIYEQARKLGYTQKLNVGPIYDAKGKFVQADRYKYPAAKEDRRLTGVGGRYEGMFKAGTQGHSQYMTVRTMTPDSAGWNIPAREGLHIAQQVADTIPDVLPKVVWGHFERWLWAY